MSQENNPSFFLISIGGVMIFEGIRRFLRSQRIKDTSSISISSAPQGLVEFEGYAYPISKTKTSIDGKKCVFLSFELQRKSKNWDTVWKYKDTQQFAIVDSSGVCCIDPINITLDTQIVTLNYNKINSKIKPEIELLVGSSVSGFPPSFGIFGRPFRIVQKAIYVGSPILVIGNFHTASTPTNLDLGPAFFGFFKRVQELTKKNKIRSKSLKNGLNALTNPQKKINLKNSLNQDQSKKDTMYLNMPIFSEKDNETVSILGVVASNQSHSLYVADCHEAELLRRISKWNLAMIVGGVAMVTLGFYLFLEKDL